MRNLEDIKRSGFKIIEQKREEFMKQSILSDEFLDLLDKNKKPFDLLMSYYRCAVMEIETKFRVLDQEYSLEYDGNPIESIKSRIKSYDSIARKVRRKNIPMTMESLEENIRDIAGVRVVCSFPEDIYELADSFLRQDDITLIEMKDYIKNPKPSGYRSLHLIVQVPIFLQKTKKYVYVEVQLRTIAMDFWASLEHKLRYKKNIPEDEAKLIAQELYDCSVESAKLDERMQKIRSMMNKGESEQILFFVGGNETLICGKHGILFCFYCQTVLYIIKNKVIDTTQLYDNNHSVVLLNYQPIMCTKHRNKAIDDVSAGYHWRTRKCIIKYSEFFSYML